MKKIAFSFSAVLLMVACSHKTVPTTTSTTNTSTSTTTTTTTTSTSANTAMIEAGHTVYTNRCGRCHELKDVTAFTQQRWDGILKSMIPKAKLDDTQAQQVTAYVMANAKK
jgi:cytochrome c5